MEPPQSNLVSPSQFSPQSFARRHFCWGWWLLPCFMLLGLTLEALHGLKIGWYLDAGNDTRRQMWTLCHAHGTLLALVHLAFAASIVAMPAVFAGGRPLISNLLCLASVLMPLGFFLGGVIIHEGDPGLGILLVPVGALALIAASFAIAILISKRRLDTDE